MITLRYRDVMYEVTDLTRQWPTIAPAHTVMLRLDSKSLTPISSPYCMQSQY